MVTFAGYLQALHIIISLFVFVEPSTDSKVEGEVG